jgi:hypothetical protein
MKLGDELHGARLPIEVRSWQIRSPVVAGLSFEVHASLNLNADGVAPGQVNGISSTSTLTPWFFSIRVDGVHVSASDPKVRFMAPLSITSPPNR